MSRKFLRSELKSQYGSNSSSSESGKKPPVPPARTSIYHEAPNIEAIRNRSAKNGDNGIAENNSGSGEQVVGRSGAARASHVPPRTSIYHEPPTRESIVASSPTSRGRAQPTPPARKSIYHEPPTLENIMVAEPTRAKGASTSGSTPTQQRPPASNQTNEMTMLYEQLEKSDSGLNARERAQRKAEFRKSIREVSNTANHVLERRQTKFKLKELLGQLDSDLEKATKDLGKSSGSGEGQEKEQHMAQHVDHEQREKTHSPSSRALIDDIRNDIIGGSSDHQTTSTDSHHQNHTSSTSAETGTVNIRAAPPLAIFTDDDPNSILDDKILGNSWNALLKEVDEINSNSSFDSERKKKGPEKSNVTKIFPETITENKVKEEKVENEHSGSVKPFLELKMRKEEQFRISELERALEDPKKEDENGDDATEPATEISTPQNGPVHTQNNNESNSNKDSEKKQQSNPFQIKTKPERSSKNSFKSMLDDFLSTDLAESPTVRDVDDRLKPVSPDVKSIQTMLANRSEYEKKEPSSPTGKAEKSSPVTVSPRTVISITNANLASAIEAAERLIQNTTVKSRDDAGGAKEDFSSLEFEEQMLSENMSDLRKKLQKEKSKLENFSKELEDDSIGSEQKKKTLQDVISTGKRIQAITTDLWNTGSEYFRLSKRQSTLRKGDAKEDESSAALLKERETLLERVKELEEHVNNKRSLDDEEESERNSKHQKIAEENESLKKEIKSLKRKVDALLEEKEQMAKQVSTLANVKEDAESSRENAEFVKAAKRNLESMENKVIELTLILEERKSIIDEQEKTLQELQNQMSETIKNDQAFIETIVNERDQVKDLQAENQKRIKELEEKLLNLEAQSVNQSELEELQQKHELVTFELDQLKQSGIEEFNQLKDSHRELTENHEAVSAEKQSLMEELQQIREELDMHSTESKEWKKKADDYENQLQMLQSQISDLHQDREQLSANLEESQQIGKELEQLQHDLEVAKAAEEKAKSELEENYLNSLKVEKNLHDLSKELEEYRELAAEFVPDDMPVNSGSVRMLLLQGAKGNRNSGDLTQISLEEMETLRKENHRLQEKVKELTARVEELKASVKDPNERMKEEFQALFLDRERIQEQLREYQKREKERESAVPTSSSLPGSRRGSRASRGLFEFGNIGEDSEKTDHSLMKAELQQKESHIKKLNEKLAILSENLEAATQSLIETGQRNEGKPNKDQSDEEQDLQRVAELEEQIKTLSNENEELKRDLEELKSQIVTLRATEGSDKPAGDTKRIANLERSLKEKTELVEDLQAALSNVRETIAQHVETLVEEIDTLKNQLTEANDLVDEYEEELKHMEKLLNDNPSDVVLLKEKIVTYEKIINDMSNELQQLEAKAASSTGNDIISSGGSGDNEAVRKLQKQLSQAKRDRADLEEMYSTLQREFERMVIQLDEARTSAARNWERDDIIQPSISEDIRNFLEQSTEYYRDAIKLHIQEKNRYKKQLNELNERLKEQSKH